MAQVVDDADLSSLHLHDRHTALGLIADDLLGMYRTILLARTLDQKIWGLNRMGKAAFVVSGQGHEGAQVGSAWAIRSARSVGAAPTARTARTPRTVGSVGGAGGAGTAAPDNSSDLDIVLPYYRDLAVALTVGMSAYEVLLAVFARPEDPNSGGRQMPNHWGSRRLGLVTGSSPIATHMPHGVGMALAAQLRGEDRVALCYFGDGAASKGDFHESLNFAGIHRPPIVFVCENNGYAISVPLSKESAVENIAQHAHSYGMPGVIVDGNDPLDVYGAVHAAVTHARRGEGPSLVECKTYRYLAHTSDDDDRTYRSPQEVEAWRKKDPVQRMKQYLIEQRLLSEQREEELDAEVRAEVDDATRRAEAAPPAEPQMAFTRVYARPLRPIPGVPAGLGDEVAPPGGGAANAAVDNAVPLLPGAGTERTIIDTIRQVQHDLLAADDRVVILGEDVGPRGGVFRATDGLYAAFGENRVIDTPLAESSIIGVAIGLALAGMRPIAEIQFADFIHSAFDQLVSEAAKIHYRSNGDFSVPLVVRCPWGGGVHGALYHSQSIEAFYAHVAGLKVVAPSTPADVAGLLRSAMDDPDPVLFLEHKKTYRLIKGIVPDGDWKTPIGVADVARAGHDLSIVTYGLHRHLALEAATALADEDYSVEVVDLRTISPLDRDTVLASVAKTGRLLIVHEDNVSFGVGAEISALVAEEAFYDLDAPIRRLAMADVPAMPFAGPMEGAVSIGAADIQAAARALLAE